MIVRACFHAGFFRGVSGKHRFSEAHTIGFRCNDASNEVCPKNDRQSMIIGRYVEQVNNASENMTRCGTFAWLKY